MLSQFLSETPLAIWPLAAFALFFATFTGVIVFVVRGAFKKQSFDHVADLPLQTDDGTVVLRRDER